MRIAIVGTGIAGNAAAWALSKRHQITVYEKDLRPGGHSHTVEFLYGDRRIAADVGFIVYNELNYPELKALFAHLGVETTESPMSFSVSSAGGGFEWAGRGRTLLETLDGVFAQRSNLASPGFLLMLRDMARFNALAPADLAAGHLRGLTLGQYLQRAGFSRRLARDYLEPMGAAIWSAPADRIADFPAENFVSFFDNHRLLHPDRARPVWRTVKGGSRNYVNRMIAGWRSSLRLGAAVLSISRTSAGVVILDSLGQRDTYDQVVIAAHTDQALAMLSDATEDERAVLGAIRYRTNTAYLHCDVRLMPRRRRAWAAWNFLRGEAAAGGGPAVTYWMNALQRIDRRYPLFVSLNPPLAPREDLTFARFPCDHPQYDAHAFAMQRQLDTIQGVRRTWFCGAWTGYGFHEDGLRSGLSVAEALGGIVPWRTARTPFVQAAE